MSTLNESEEDAMETDNTWNESPQPIIEDMIKIDDAWNKSPSPLSRMQ